MVAFCEQGGRLSGIAEAINEEDEELENTDDLTNLPGQELVTLESGALPLGNNMLDLIDKNNE